MKNKIKENIEKGKRLDKRKLLEYRPIKIEVGVSKNAEGSARVKIGDTDVIAGVKIDVGEPYPDQEDEGTLVTTVELLPISSSRFEDGPPSIEAIEIARVIDRGIRESGFIEWKKLCIKKGEKVYRIFIDIYPINYDGNIIDAGFIASVAALLNAKIPRYDEKEEKIKYGELTNKKLPLSKNIPIMITFFKIGNNIFIDPTLEEQDASDARLSIALTKNKKIYINALQKGGEGTFSEEEIKKIVEIAEEKFDEIYKKIEEIK